MNIPSLYLLPLAFSLGGASPQGPSQNGPTAPLQDRAAIQRALAAAKPGDMIRLAPGTYPGGFSSRGLKGTPEKPIVITSADPKNPAQIDGGEGGLYLSNVEHIEIRDLIIQRAGGNGVNIDDGGQIDTPSHHVILKNLTVRDIGPRGNRDGIKLSGVDDFRVENCTLERWGSGGSGIDMVGCHRGLIVGCTFGHKHDNHEANGVQAKGGSEDITIQRCTFDHAGGRAVNLGGSTGMPYFRPKGANYEARNLTVEDCTFIGSMAPLAFVGVDGAKVHHNTIYRPERWCVRILQETNEPSFVPCRNGVFANNLVVFRSDEMVLGANVGDKTAPETFTFERNAWHCLDDPARSRPKGLPTPERDGVYDRAPRFLPTGPHDVRQDAGSPLAAFGAR